VHDRIAGVLAMRHELTVQIDAVGDRRHVAVDIEERAFEHAGRPVELARAAGRHAQVPRVGHASQHQRRGLVV
jgi:hypothetical protein